MKYLSVSQTAERWGITRRRIQRLCNEGRVEGAMKFAKRVSNNTDGSDVLCSRL